MEECATPRCARFYGDSCSTRRGWGRSPAGPPFRCFSLRFPFRRRSPALPLPLLAVGSFASSEPLLDRIWQVSITTANDMLAPGPLTTDAGGNDCAIELSVVIIDGAVRDRCPYVGDQWVVGAAFDVSTPNFQVQRAMLEWYAAHQRADGSIPASPRCGAATTLFDYDAYWLQTLHQYALDSGDLDFVRSVWPAVARLIDTRYAPARGATACSWTTVAPTTTR